MPPITNENDVAAPSSKTSATRDAASNRQQTVALEVPVTVNGARPVEGSEKREPFSESTKTVLVHGNGAVIRLSSAVAPGQLLFLTNDKSKKEVVCQVIKSKNYQNLSGYVELQFTEPVIGFWGMRFPSDRIGPQSTASVPSAPNYLHSETEVEPLAPLPDSVYSPKQTALEPTTDAPQFTGLVGPQAEITEPLNTELRPNDRSASKADFLSPAPEVSTESLKIENSKLQEQLSALLFFEQKEASANSLQNAGTNPQLDKIESLAPGSASISPVNAASASMESTLDVEEVKIPAWLEPSARKSAAPTPQETLPETPSSNVQRSSVPESHEDRPSAPTRESRTAKPAAPVFAKTLLAKTSSDSRVSSSRSNKSVWIAAAAAVLATVVVGGAWYLRQSGGQGPTNLSAATLRVAAESTAPSADPVQQPKNASGLEQTPEPKPVASSSSPAPISVSSSLQGKSQPAVLSERIPRVLHDSASGTNAAPSAVLIDPGPAAAEPEISKPTLGKVHLAKPKINASARTQAATPGEPTLDIASSQALPDGASPDGSGITSAASQPTAPPLPVGGAVVPARMSFSVAPVYPALAKTQHISGNVRIDALIAANGRVSSMKVISGPPLLHQAAMDALRQWKYQPATLDGKPVPMHLTVTIQFRLQ